jgi:hypothetical protein
MFEDEVGKFIERAKRVQEQRPVRAKTYLLFCKEGIDLVKKYPEVRSDIGHYLTSMGASVRLGDMIDFASDLEYPSRDKDWVFMEQLVEETLKELSEDFRSKD